MFVTVTYGGESTTPADLRGTRDNGHDSITMTREFEAFRQDIHCDTTAGMFCPPGTPVPACWYLNVNEWQKRSRPHAHSIHHFKGEFPSMQLVYDTSGCSSSTLCNIHIIIISPCLQTHFHHVCTVPACTLLPGEPWTRAQVDSIMWTHFPTAAEEQLLPGLTALVKKNMIHGHTHRCGGLEGACTWHYPQPVVPETFCDDTGHWHTHRSSAERFIVPYHPLLLWKTKCHACFIIISGTAAIGYLLQYGCKGES